LFPQPSFDVRRCLTEIRIAILIGASSLFLIDNFHDTHPLNYSPFPSYTPAHTEYTTPPVNPLSMHRDSTKTKRTPLCLRHAAYFSSIDTASPIHATPTRGKRATNPAVQRATKRKLDRHIPTIDSTAACRVKRKSSAVHVIDDLHPNLAPQHRDTSAPEHNVELVFTAYPGTCLATADPHVYARK